MEPHHCARRALAVLVLCAVAAVAVAADTSAGAGAAASASASNSNSSGSAEEWAADQRHFRDLMVWLEGGGSRSVPIGLTTYASDYRGVHTTGAIANRSLIMTIPRQHLMSDQTARRTPIGQAIAAAGYVPRNVQSLLAAMLCEQRELMLEADAIDAHIAADAAAAAAAGTAAPPSAAGVGGGGLLVGGEAVSPGSRYFWVPYLRGLPRDFPSLPLFFSDAELAWLQGSAALQNIATLQTDVRSEFDQLQARVPAFRRFDYRTFLWARLTVMTRAFSVYVNRAKLQALIPLADLLNHHMLAAKLQWGYDDALQAFALTALADYGAGEQLYLSYGSKSNTALLVDYGFVLPDNPWQSAVIVVAVPSDTPLFNTKMLFFDDTTQYVRVFAQYTHKDSQTAFAVARFICGTQTELQPLLAEAKFKLADVTPLNPRNEACALQLVAAAARAKLPTYARSLHDDMELLRAHDNGTAPLSANIRNALHVTKAEKEVLHRYMRMGDAAAPLLALSWAELGRTQALAPNQWTEFNEYISLVVVPLVFRKSFGGKLSAALAAATIGMGHGRVLRATAVTPTAAGENFNASAAVALANRIVFRADALDNVTRSTDVGLGVAPTPLPVAPRAVASVSASAVTADRAFVDAFAPARLPGADSHSLARATARGRADLRALRRRWLSRAYWRRLRPARRRQQRAWRLIDRFAARF